MDNSTEQIGAGVWRVEVGPLLNAYVIAADGRSDDGGLTLVDCGTARSGPRLVRSIRLLGFAPTSVNNVVLTHWHADHMGSAARFAASTAAPDIHVGAGDLDAVSGGNRSPHRGLPREDVSGLGRLLGRTPLTRPGPPVTANPLPDAAVLPYANNAVVVASPGHTRGHIAVLVPAAGVLIAGDAVMNLGRLTQGFGPFRSARSHEPATLRKLAALDFSVLAVGHGPPVVNGAQRKLARLASRVSR